jgi:type IV secretory pathway VirB10-like protein
MSETPKFEVIDRRKLKKMEEEQGGQSTTVESASQPAAPAEQATPSVGPRLVVNESRPEPAPQQAEQPPVEAQKEPGMPPAPTAEESHEQKTAYDASAQRLEDILRAQNPGMGKQPAIGFEHLVQQFYVSAMIQMGAGSQEGQRPQIDILGARNTIDLLGVLAEKTKGNLTEAEDRTLQSVLFEARMAFLDLTSMINMQSVPAPPPPGKR